jgi:transposase
MDTKQLYSKLLRLRDPWYVDRVEVDEKADRIDVYVLHHNPIRVACPECGEFYAAYDHAPEREFQHLATCQMRTFVHVRLPRVKCPTHGVRQILSDFGEPNAHMTYQLEERVIELAQECSIAAVARLSGLGWDASYGCVARAVERGFRRKPRHLPARIAVDEKSFAKGHKYETLVCDHGRGTVEYVADHHEQESLEQYYRQFTEKQRETVQVVTMDMWDPFIAATRNQIPHWEKKIVFDRFHVMRHVTVAVDDVRKEEHKRLRERGDDLLRGTKYLWLWSRENIPDTRKSEFRALQNADLDVSRAWAIKENLRHLWDFVSERWARKFFKRWFFWATHSRLRPIVAAARTIKDHFENVVTYVHHQITNALVEGLNSKIEKVKRMACGFRNRAHYRTAIYFHCGGLDLWPRKPGKPQIIWKPA